MAIIYPPGTAPELEGASITINYHETASTSATNLTGTKWLINSELSTGALLLQNLSFISNATNYTGIWLRLQALSTVTYIIDEDHVNSAYESGWTNEAYRTIEITGGTDATNSDFVAWLQANATQIVEPVITDLTGTKWLLNDVITYESSFPTYNINYNAYCESGAVAPLSGLYMDHAVAPQADVDFYCMRYTGGGVIDFYNFFLPQVLYTANNDTTSMTNTANDPNFNVELFNGIIEVTGGTDATNTNLIAWLQANATQITEPPTNTYELTHSLTNLSHGNITIQITPDTGYTYPSNITVTNGTLVSYNSATGVAVVSGDDTTIISATCAESTLINFSINLNSTLYSFQAETNMTWTEFANSSYNENNSVVINGSVVSFSGVRNEVYNDANLQNLVDATDTITADTTYYAGIGA